MTRGFLYRGLIAALAALLAPTLAHAAPVYPDKQARGTVRLIQPTTFSNVNDLDFGWLYAPTAGTAVVNPNTDALTVTGGVIAVGGGAPHAALFSAISPVKNVVIIRIPNRPVTLTRVGGTETMTVDNWTLSGNARRTVAAQEPWEFKVGGTLYVNANQAEGVYVGTFSVEIQNP